MTDSVFEAAAEFGTATLHEAAGKIGVLPAAIKPVAPSFRVCGPAFTVFGPPIDNLWLHKAIAAAKPGDVLIAHVSDVYEAGYWGEIMSTGALAKGLGGLVVDGCVRDGAILEKLGFPVFARGLCPKGTGKDFSAGGGLNEPIVIGDVTINPGDLVAGDTDGVVVIPRDRLEATVKAAAEREADEAEVMKKLRAGATTVEVYGWDK